MFDLPLRGREQQSGRSLTKGDGGADWRRAEDAASVHGPSGPAGAFLLRSSSLRGLPSGLGGQHAPVPQVGVQRVEDVELLLGLQLQQLLQNLAGVWTSARDQTTGQERDPHQSQRSRF